MKRVLIIAHFCDYGDENTNNRFNYIAGMLQKAGMDVELVTSSFSHRNKQQRKAVSDIPYKVTLIQESSYQKNISVKRLFYSHPQMARNLKNYLANIEPPAAIYCAIPSINVAEVAAEHTRKNKIPFILDIQDLWPEAFKLVLKMPLISDLAFLPMTLQANRVYGQADRVIAVSETYMKRGLASNGKDKTGLCVYLGTDLGSFDKSSKTISVEKPDGELWITYAGTLGHSYNIEIVFDALNQLPDGLGKNVVFHIFGDGPYLERFQKYAKNCKMQSVFHGRMAYPAMVANLCKSDIAVNPIMKGAAQSIINKHADYAAAGLPVVNTQECEEYRKLIEEYACGINCRVDSVEDVAQAIQTLVQNEELRKQMGERSRKMAEEKFDRAVTYQKIVDIVENYI